MSFFTTEQIKRQYDHMLSVFRPKIGDIGFSWIKQATDFSLFNLKELVAQIKEWRKIEVTAMAYNNKEFEIDGRKWYVLIAQPYKNGELQECSVCPASLFLFGTMVSGFTYAFTQKKERDLAFRMITDESGNGVARVEKCILIAETQSEETIRQTCPICLKSYTGFGNSAYPICEDTNARCCDNCNERYVIPTRMEKVQESIDKEKAEKAKIAETEILANPFVVEIQNQENKEKNKITTKQGETRKANKSKAEEKKRKEESDRQTAIADAHRAEQQRQKQQTIAKKKKDEKIKASLLLLAKLQSN